VAFAIRTARMLRLSSVDWACFVAAGVGEAPEEPGPVVELDQQGGDRRERQLPASSCFQGLGLGGTSSALRGGMTRWPSASSRTAPTSSGDDFASTVLQVGHRGVQFLHALLQCAPTVGGLTDQRAELRLPAAPLRRVNRYVPGSA